MPHRPKDFAWFGPRQPSFTKLRSSPAVTSSQRHTIFIARSVKTVEERTNAHDLGQPAKQRRGSAIASGGIDCAELRSNRQRRYFTLRLRRLRAADATAIARDEDAGDIELAPLIG